jgi:pyruvate,water dikinase
MKTKKVRNEMGLHNVKLMIAFVAHLEEGEKVLAEMAKKGWYKASTGCRLYD